MRGLMKKYYEGLKSRVRQNWRNLMDSSQNKISRGASNIFRAIPWARGDSWRRHEAKKPSNNKK